jgi:excisionase family DNA binding protein
MPEPWVSVDEVAAHLGVAKDSVYRWIEMKKLPARKLGRLWKFRLSEIDMWVKETSNGDNQTNLDEIDDGRRNG